MVKYATGWQSANMITTCTNPDKVAVASRDGHMLPLTKASESPEGIHPGVLFLMREIGKVPFQFIT